MSGKSIVVDGVEYRIGDRLPLEKPKLVVKPSSNADVGGKSIRGAFCNGRGGK